MLFPTRPTLIAFMTPRDNITESAFFEYWGTHHASLFVNLPIVQKNAIVYQQVHANRSEDADAIVPGATLSNVSGWALVSGETIEDVLEIFASDDYANIMVPDEEKFINRSLIQWMVSDVLTFIDHDAVNDTASQQPRFYPIPAPYK